jgi:L-cysteine S-thiosulfotransferase
MALQTLRVAAAIMALALIAGVAGAPVARADELAAYRVSGDRIAEALGGTIGDAVRGRRAVLNRETGNCLICHQVREPYETFQGTLGPPLDGVGARLDVGQLRLRLVDQTLINPATLMPPYYRTEGLTRVGTRYRGKPVLAAQDIEDVVAYLLTLK